MQLQGTHSFNRGLGYSATGSRFGGMAECVGFWAGFEAAIVRTRQPNPEP